MSDPVVVSQEGADPPVRERRVRVAAFVICTDDAGRTLLARWLGPNGPRWTLPGGGLDEGEQPQDGALRELTEETGYVGELDALVGVDSDRFVGLDGIDRWAIRIIYRGHVVGGSLVFEQGGSTDIAAWVSPAERAALEAVPLVELGIGLAALPGQRVTRSAPAAPHPGAQEADPSALIAVHAYVRDEAGRRLLVRRIAAGNGVWHAPGGVIDHGAPLDSTLRAIVREQTGLEVAPKALVSATSHLADEGDGKRRWCVRLGFDAGVVAGTLSAEPREIEAAWFEGHETQDGRTDP